MRVLCVGQIVVDVVIRPVDALPPRGVASRLEDFEIVAGGCAANTACALAKLGVETSIAGVVGRDALGGVILDELAATGVDVSGVARRADVPTTSAIVMVESGGERSFFYRPGGNEALSGEIVTDQMLDAADFVHIGGVMKLVSLDAAELLRRAKERGCTTSLDTDWDTSGKWMARLEPVLPHVDYMMTNEEEGAQLTGCKSPRDIGRSLLARGPRVAVVKRGARGAVSVSESSEKEFPSYTVPVRDTTCAGDSFAAGLLCGLVRGWDLDDSVRLANAAGALCTTQISHRAIVSFRSVKELMETAGGQATGASAGKAG
jgi:sugar/nucleoside kinase (ribokinase family)